MDFIKKYVSNEPADLNSPEAIEFNKSILLFPEEAVYIYSLSSRKLIFAKGWEAVLGYPDEEMNLKLVFSTTSEKYIQFALEINNKSLQFLDDQRDNLEQYCLLMELEKIHKNGSLVPMIVKIAVLDSIDNKVNNVIGRFQVNRSIKLGNVMKYAAYGPEKSKFEETLNKLLFHHYAISQKELEAISLVSEGYTFKEIAYKFGISHSAVEKRILPLYKKFNVKSMAHLIRFCFENQLLPLSK